MLVIIVVKVPIAQHQILETRQIFVLQETTVLKVCHPFPPLIAVINNMATVSSKWSMILERQPCHSFDSSLMEAETISAPILYES